MRRRLRLQTAVLPLTIAAGIMLLAGTSGTMAAGKNGTIGVSMPNIKGPWFTPVLYPLVGAIGRKHGTVTVKCRGLIAAPFPGSRSAQKD